jgi:hypothetical protein
VVYRALNAKDAQLMNEGVGLQAKNPAGSWGLREHVQDGSGRGSWGNDPWIATSRDLKVAREFDGGNGIVAIDLDKVSSDYAEAWMIYQRDIPAYHLSIWQQEVSIHQWIPPDAIMGFVS